MTRNELAKSLRSLSAILSEWGNVRNPAILNNIGIREHENSLIYSIPKTEPLIFINAEIDRHCLPSGIEKLPDTEIQIRFTTLHKEQCGQNDDIDPLIKLGVNIIVDATYIVGDELGEATCSWHIDKHKGGNTQYAHPEYHINFGGSHMESLPTNFGNLLLLNSPRAVHPPLDIILGCDFVIRNFYSKKSYKAIFDKPAYKGLTKLARTRYWKPFAKAMVSEWYNDLNVTNLSNMKLIGS